MNQIENKECFKNCTKLCKPHESNKAMWDIYEKLKHNKMDKKALLDEQKKIRHIIKHSEFI